MHPSSNDTSGFPIARDEARGEVFIIEDEAPVRNALVFHLNAHGHSVAAFEAAEPFVSTFDPEADTGCVVADVRLPGIDGVGLLGDMARRRIGLPVVMITGFADVPRAVRAMRAGAYEFLEKPVAPRALLSAVTRALAGAQGQRSFQREAAAASMHLATLSGRERDVFEGLVPGRLGKEVAADLGISPRMVEIYRANAMQKLGARTLAELLRMGLLAAMHEGAGKRKRPTPDLAAED